MRTSRLLSLFVLLQLLFLSAFGQVARQFTIPLKKESILPERKLDEEIISRLNKSTSGKPTVVVLQFNSIPTEKQRATLLINGIRLQNYLGGYAYVVSIEHSLKTDVLLNCNARSIFPVNDDDKISSFLQNVTTDTIVHSSIFSFTAIDDAIAQLNEKGFRAKKIYGDYPILEIHVPSNRLSELAHFNFIEYIEPPPPPLTELNYKSTAGTRANILHLPNYNLNGEGILFQVNEVGGYPQDHIDLKDRSIGSKVLATGGYHSTHVHGIIAGAGLINELYKGYAPKARFNTSFEIGEPPTDIFTYGADLTNNSYASGRLCSYATTSANLSLPSLIVDRQSIQFRSLIHVMSAGNSGTYQCPVFPLGYNTIYLGYQSAKSTLTVGATFSNGMLAGFSSKGPGREGRFKPEIVAPGANIISTTPYNYYGNNNGTSMSGPAVVGGLGLLYQRYMQLHGTKPDNALMKPLLCNTATDLGPAGPDYGYGFGFMNLNRAIQVLDAGNFYKDSVANQKTKTKTISVPQSIAKLKLMLYWQDPPASPLTAKPLVNDLDIKVSAPDGTEFLPFILDTIPSLVTNSARRGVDHTNNIEQVVIDSPLSGNYTVTVNGYEIGEGEQQSFYVVYDLVPNAVQLTFPANGEVLAPDDNISVQWDSWGDTSSTYTIEFSTDNGNSWQAISTNAVGTSFDSKVPSIVTNEVSLRVTRNSDGKTSSGNFRITGVPLIALSASQCPGSIAIEWPKVNGATDYEVMWYRNGDMTSAVISSDTSYIFQNLSEDSVYYVTVRARKDGLPGRRAVALSIQPNKGDCKNSIHDHDLKPQALMYPLVGRAFTSKRFGVEAISMRIKNLDDDSSKIGFTVAYSVDGKPWVTETINNAIAGNGLLDYTFQTPFDFSLPGNYSVRLAVTSSIDNNHQNDTISCIVRHITNAPVSLQNGVTEKTFLSNTTTYNSNYTGIDQLDRFDYENTSPADILRVGQGIVFDYSPTPDTAKRQSLTATYNLSLFDTLRQSVELQFNYYRYSMPTGAFDSLLVRGSDTASWILVQDLLPPDSPRSINKQFRIPLTGYLQQHGQNFSSSFQVRWVPSPGIFDVSMSVVSIFNKTNDAGLISVDSLLPYSCGLSNATPIWVTVQNNNKTALNDVPVKYRINNGNTISEIIPSIPALATTSYRFKQLADLSSPNDYNIEAWTENADDAYSANDTSRLTVQNLKLVNAFPFLEDFENGNGGWFTNGQNSSWEYGLPISTLIKGAASGNKAWKTNLDGNYNELESSAIYAGCFDFSKLSKPVISFSLAMNTDSCQPFYCDRMQVQFCPNGKAWANLNNRATPVQNWQTYFTSKWYNRWHVVTARLADTFKIVPFRIQFLSDNYNSFEGIGIDDFHLYDSSFTIYEGNSTEDHQYINGGQQWIEFKKSNKLLGAIQPQGLDLGEVQLQTFTNSGAVRNFHGQYYLNRNFVFKPSKALTDSVIVRLYFTDRESDSLLFANSCSSCTLPKNAYKFGISYYKSNDSTELDSSILNNRKGEWSFIPNSKIKVVPFMTGYYAEFKVKDAGEFRLSNGGLDEKSVLPVQILNFSAEPFLSAVNLKWNTTQEINIDHFDIEVARGNTSFKNDQFEKVGDTKSRGRAAFLQSYNFTDDTTNKTDVLYYRLKIVDVFGNYSYSNTVPVVFKEEMKWQIFPNPSNGKCNLLYQSVPGDNIQLKLFNSVGALVKEMHFTANGFVQYQQIDLSKKVFANGVYVLHITTQQKTHILRLVKQ